MIENNQKITKKITNEISKENEKKQNNQILNSGIDSEK